MKILLTLFQTTTPLFASPQIKLTPTFTNQKIHTRPDSIKKFKPTAFAEDASRELLILSHDGNIYTISPK